MPATTKVESVILRAVLKPTAAATELDDEVVNNYKDAIVNGALFRLLRTPAKGWTDYNAAQMYGALYAEGVEEAENEARAANTPIARSVNMAATTPAQQGEDTLSIGDIREEWWWIRPAIEELLAENPTLTYIPEDVYAEVKAERAMLFVAEGGLR